MTCSESAKLMLTFTFTIINRQRLQIITARWHVLKSKSLGRRRSLSTPTHRGSQRNVPAFAETRFAEWRSIPGKKSFSMLLCFAFSWFEKSRVQTVLPSPLTTMDNVVLAWTGTPRYLMGCMIWYLMLFPMSICLTLQSRAEVTIWWRGMEQTTLRRFAWGATLTSAETKHGKWPHVFHSFFSF